MTGYGEAEETGATLSVVVEVRAVNNRYLKINYRSSDWIGGDETRVEKIVRQYIKRGTVQVQVRIADSENKTSFRFNTEILNAYREQLQDFDRHHPMDGNVALESLLNLPGVIVEETTNPNIKEEAGPLAERAISIDGKAGPISQAKEVKRPERRASARPASCSSFPKVGLAIFREHSSMCTLPGNTSSVGSLKETAPTNGRRLFWLRRKISVTGTHNSMATPTAESASGFGRPQRP